MTEKIDGSKIADCWTYGGYIEVTTKRLTIENMSEPEDLYIIPMDTLLEIIKGYEFETVQKKVHLHLVNPKPKRA
jgi:hypothetical protein